MGKFTIILNFGISRKLMDQFETKKRENEVSQKRLTVGLPRKN